VRLEIPILPRLYGQKPIPGNIDVGFFGMVFLCSKLQYRKVVEYNHLRSMLEKVRPYLKEWIDSPIKAAAGPSAG
jgi:hypothetical protein